MENSLFSSSICRFCLLRKSKIFHINSHMVLKIKDCINMQIVDGDGYPRKICISCLRKLNNAYKFKKKCENSAAILKNSLLNVTSSFELASTSANYSEKKNVDNTPSNAIFVQKIDSTYLLNKQNLFSSTVHKEEENNLNSNVQSSFGNVNNEFFKVDEINSDLKITKKTISKGINFKSKKSKSTLQCIECGKLYKSEKFLVRHVKIHNTATSIYQNSENSEIDNLKKMFICSICGKGFSQISNLNIHKRSHTGEKPYQCDICSKSFTQLSNLYVHKRIHSNIREFKCQMCSMDFKLFSHLTEHMKTHSNVKSYQCSSCGKGFHKSSHLLTHIRTHTGEKPFSCEHCGKSFNDSSNLTTHIRTHTGIKPFTCNICNKAFGQKVSMIRHQKRKHSSDV